MWAWVGGGWGKIVIVPLGGDKMFIWRYSDPGISVSISLFRSSLCVYQILQIFCVSVFKYLFSPSLCFLFFALNSGWICWSVSESFCFKHSVTNSSVFYCFSSYWNVGPNVYKIRFFSLFNFVREEIVPHKRDVRGDKFAH